MSTFLAINLRFGVHSSWLFVIRFLLCTLLPLPNYAQTSFSATDARWRDAGLPYIRTYSASEYGGDQQNWDIVQDRRGVMYFANQNCLLEYDGVSWRQIYTGNRLSVRSVDIDSRGRIWMGAALEIGYLSPDASGNLHYTSLLSHVPAHIREVANYWRAAITSQGVYFKTRNFLLRWSERSQTMKTWRSETGFGDFKVFEDALYIQKGGVGLMRMAGDFLRLVPSGERFADIEVSALLPFTGSTPTPAAASEEFADHKPGVHDSAPRTPFLTVTRTHGLFLYDGVSFQPFKTEADAILLQDTILCGVVLVDGSYALGTRNSGLVVIGRQGNLRLILNMASGLPGSSVYQAYVDSQGGLWLGSNRGIVRVEFPSPLSLHRGAPALRSGTTKVLRYKGKIYAATAEGLYKMEQSVPPVAPPAFKAVDSLKAQFGDMVSVGSLFFAATSNGAYQIEEDRVAPVQKGATSTGVKDSPVCFLRSRYNPGRVYVGLGEGLALLELRAGRWQFASQVPGIYETIHEIAEESLDVLWLTTRLGIAIRLELPSLYLSPPSGFSSAKIERFGEAQGLTTGWILVRPFNGKTLFTTDKGLRHFDPASRTFQLDSSFGGVFADSTWEVGDGPFFYIDSLGRAWTSRFRNNRIEVGVAIPEPNGGYSWHASPFRRFGDFGDIWTFYIDQKHKGVFWFGGADGIIRYDETIPKDYTAGYPALIRRVVVNGDSVIYGGADADADADSVSVMKAPILDYENNTIRIEYAAPYYDNEAANRYQYFLEGFDNGWSAWTGETKVDYRKLPEGRYRFRVRARNIYQSVGGESVFALKILPPWRRTWWSYLLYTLLVFGALYAIRRYEVNRQQHKHRAELESVAANKLKELDKLKSDFFANISHEFRTPLTLILGPAEQLLEKQNGDDKSKLSLIRRNAQRLLQLIDQLLDLSKLERGKLRLRAGAGDFIAFLKGLVMSFDSLAERKGIEMQFEVNDARQPEPSQALPETWFDRDKIEKIFTNLLSNAFKFTPEGGRVSVTATLLAGCRLGAAASVEGQEFEIIHPRCAVCVNSAGEKGRQKASRSVNCVEITVADTGEGIPAEQLPHIFDRFYQADSSSRRAHGGTGIGLALVKELVDMHYGSIVVRSEEGRGAVFTVCLPLGKSHLQENEMVETPLSSSPLGEKAKEGVDMPVVFVPEAWEEPGAPLHVVAEDAPTPGSDDLPIILIIEDNADVRAYIREQLETESEYSILEAADGEAGIARAIEAIPDLVLSDVMMPKKDGVEVCRTLKTDARTSHIPVILLTAKAGEQEKLAGLETGADAYILKPFRQKELAVRVRKLIELRRKLRQRYSTATVIKPSEVEATSMDRAFLERVIAAIETNIGEEGFNAETLASETAMSISQLNRKLNALIGQPAGQMLRSMRLQRAADLLAKKSGTVAEICYAVGFSDQANFTRGFKKQFGCSPSEYQKTHQE